MAGVGAVSLIRLDQDDSSTLSRFERQKLSFERSIKSNKKGPILSLKKGLQFI